MDILDQLEIAQWEGPFAAEVTKRTAAALETGKVLFAPDLHFELSEAERRFLSPDILDGKSKNLSFRPATGALAGDQIDRRGARRAARDAAPLSRKSLWTHECDLSSLSWQAEARVYQLSSSRDRRASELVA